MTSMQPYVLTSPARNEAENLPMVLGRVEQLDPPPAVWLVVDDGSTDGSREWLEEKAKGHPFLVVLDAPEANTEYLGGHVARIKRWGLERAISIARERGLDPGYAGVMDSDILPPVEQYRVLIEAFENNPKLGITSGAVRTTGKDDLERWQREDLPWGATQFFRITCLDDIGGLPPWPGFDGAANVKARARGWDTRLFKSLVAIHTRETATRFGVAAGYRRRGRYAYFLCLHPLMVLARSAAYTAHKPHTAGFYFLMGWAEDAIKRRERCPDEDVRREYGWKRVVETAQALVGRGPGFAK